MANSPTTPEIPHLKGILKSKYSKSNPQRKENKKVITESLITCFMETNGLIRIVSNPINPPHTA